MNNQPKTIKIPSTICASCISTISIAVTYFFGFTNEKWWPIFVFISLIVILYSLWFDIVLTKNEDHEKQTAIITTHKNTIINNAKTEAEKIINNANGYKAEVENNCKIAIKEAEKIKIDKEFNLKIKEKYLQLIRVHKIRISNFRKNYNEQTDSHIEKMKKNNVEQYKIDKYTKHRRMQFYQLDRPNITVMEEKAMIRFIIASLSDELENI